MRRIITTILNWVRLLTTSSDNKTPDVIAIGSILLGTEFLVLAAWSAIVQGNAFDAMAFGGGAAALLGATGAALRLKPQPEA